MKNKKNGDAENIHEEQKPMEAGNAKADEKMKQEIQDLQKQLNETKADLEKKSKEIESLTDMMKRRQADFENYKKRIQKTLEDSNKLAIKDFALDVIHINDDLIRAMEAASNITATSVDEACKSFSEGFVMISKRIEETLKKYGIEEIDSINTEFDPCFNEAVEIEQRQDVDKDTVVKIYQKGFKLDEFVLRCAKVKVAKAVRSDVNADCCCSTDENGCGGCSVN